MFQYEIRKVFTRRSNQLALLLMLAVFVLTCHFAMDVTYINDQGERETGFAAVRQLRAAQKDWTGVLTTEQLQRVIEENLQIRSTPQAKSTNYKENDIAYSWGQGIREIRELLNDSYAEGFRSYDYYRADTLSSLDASSFYENRIKLLRSWLADEAKDQFTETEKDYLIHQYEKLETPFYYDYVKGWYQLLEYAPTIIMISTLILGYLVAGIFSAEFQWKSDAIFFSTVYGRNKAVTAKIKAGLAVVTVLYWVLTLLYSGIVLLYLGADGAFCPVQVDSSGWKCFYNIQMWQKYLLTVFGGYIGCLFSCLLTMLVSAKTKSTVLAVLVPFVLIFIPSFVSNIKIPLVNKVLGLLPDRLLQVNRALGYFDLYELGGRVIGAVPILLILYTGLSLILLPLLYRVYSRKQIN